MTPVTGLPARAPCLPEAWTVVDAQLALAVDAAERPFTTRHRDDDLPDWERRTSKTCRACGCAAIGDDATCARCGAQKRPNVSPTRSSGQETPGFSAFALLGLDPARAKPPSGWPSRVVGLDRAQPWALDGRPLTDPRPGPSGRVQARPRASQGACRGARPSIVCGSNPLEGRRGADADPYRLPPDERDCSSGAADGGGLPTGGRAWIPATAKLPPRDARVSGALVPSNTRFLPPRGLSTSGIRRDRALYRGASRLSTPATEAT